MEINRDGFTLFKEPLERFSLIIRIPVIYEYSGHHVGIWRFLTYCNKLVYNFRNYEILIFTGC